MPTSRAPGLARVALAAIRIVNGSTPLFAPAVLARNLGVRRDDNQAVQYVLRMFGVRTVVIGLQLTIVYRMHPLRELENGFKPWSPVAGDSGAA
jgi:uncharacterized protein YjeT (DUF2065 family)